MGDFLQNRPIEIVVRHVIRSAGRGDRCATAPTGRPATEPASDLAA
jgi:hypothetical protein